MSTHTEAQDDSLAFREAERLHQRHYLALSVLPLAAGITAVLRVIF